MRHYINVPSYKIVYEWEDIISERLALTINVKNGICRKIIRKISKTSQWGSLNNILSSNTNLSLMYVMRAKTDNNIDLTKSVIPIIIDFWLNEKELPAFYKTYRNVPLILVTNLEVKFFLDKHNCPIPVEHWALSYPDTLKPKENVRYDKKYDLAFLGRPDPFFINLVKKYASKHEDFVYVITKGTEKNRTYYTNKGEFICKDEGRSTYFSMMHNTRVTCYTTPGFDMAKKETSFFNQVTPRLFEMLCNGCQVIGHYPDAADTNWYKLKDLIPQVDNYNQFEKVLDEMLDKEVEFEKVQKFMSRHYTSQRIDPLRNILRKYNISI